jgi:hypothetical protein
MVSARQKNQKKRSSARTAQPTKKRTRPKDRRQMHPVAARARTEVRRGIFPTVQDARESSRNAERQSSEHSGEHARNTSGARNESPQRAAEQSAGNLGPVLKSETIYANAMRSILQELFTFVQQRMHQNFTRLLALSSAHTPAQLMAAQMEFVRDNVESLLQSTGRLANISMQMGHEGARRMNALRWAPR